MKTIKQVPVVPVYVESCPLKDEMEFGKIYISLKYKGSTHLCLCGCGVECYLPLKEDWWSLNDDKGKITISPSILQRFECKSHYIITKGKANFV